MSTEKVFRTVCGLGVLVGLMAGVALAQTSDKRTLFTFNRPISLPGITLPAGQYLFRLVDTTTSRKVIQVLSADGKTPYVMLHSIPDVRRDVSSETEVRFMETAKGTPSAVKAWWYTGERTGYEFIYPKEQARLLARGSVEPILTTRTETKKPEETKTAELARIEPSGQEVAVAPEPQPIAPAGESQVGVVVPESVEARNELPKTATELPLIGLIGLLALAGAASLRLGRAVRS